MLIRCEKCSTLYELDDKLLPPQGAPVQCSKCQFVFKAYPAPSRQPNAPERAANDAPEAEAQTGTSSPDAEPRTRREDVVREGGMLAHSFEHAAPRSASTPIQHLDPEVLTEADSSPRDLSAGGGEPVHASRGASGSAEPQFTADGRPIRKVPFPVGDATQQGPRTPPFRGAMPKAPKAASPRIRWVIVAVIVVAVLVAAAAAWLTLGSSGPSRPRPPAGAAPAGQSRAATQEGTPATPARN